ncbi:MAG: hypothetical protein U0132_22185 [Gemmatimonadaceae bacterium]
MTVPSFPLESFVRAYEDTHRDLLDSDPEFAAWLAQDYRPIAGGWQY